MPVHPSHVTAVAQRLHTALSNGEGAVPERTTEGAQIVLELIDGYLRGATPDTLPDDLLGVAVAAGLRIAKGFAQSGQMFINRGDFNTIADLRPWTGFMIVERLILNRYRRTTA